MGVHARFAKLNTKESKSYNQMEKKNRKEGNQHSQVHLHHDNQKHAQVQILVLRPYAYANVQSYT